jgi:hypothetical protein
MSRGPQRRLSYNSATCFHRAVKFYPSTIGQSQAISGLPKGLWARNLLHPELLPALAWQSGRAGTSCSRYSCDSSNLRTHRTSSLSLQSCSEKHSVKPRSKAPRNSALRHGKNGHRAGEQVDIAIAIALTNPARKASALMPGDGQRDDVNTRCLEDISKTESPQIDTPQIEY